MTFCAQASIEVEEGLFGSAASETDVWLVLEYYGQWEPKPLPGSDLPTEVRNHLEQWLERVPRARLQFIRRPGGSGQAPYALYLAHSREERPWMLRIALERYEDLLALDLDAAIQGAAVPGASAVEGPMHLVCTHGKRDRCCAKWGLPVYLEFAHHDPEGSWQTTHLGGHRFAANVVLLPHGISYGRLDPGDVASMVEAHRRGEIYDVERLRGRTCHSAPTQAAEYYVRRETGFLGLEGLRHMATERTADGRWRVRFAAPQGRVHELEVIEEETEVRPKSCGDDPTPATRFRRA